MICHMHPHLLLAQPHVRVEDSIVELLLKGEDTPADLLFVQQLVKHLGLPKPKLQGKWQSKGGDTASGLQHEGKLSKCLQS